MNRLLPLLAVLAFVGIARPAVAAPERVAVVNMVDLISEHPQALELQRRFETRQSEAEAYATQQNKVLRALAGEIELMERNNPMRRSKEKDLMTQQTLLKLELEWRKEQAMHEYMQGLEGLYSTIQGLIAGYARQQGIQLVLLKSNAEISAMDFNDYAAKVQLRTVVFSETALDITARIKAMFAPAPPSPSRPPAPPPGAPPAGPPRPR